MRSQQRKSEPGAIALFQTGHQYDSYHGAFYGSCSIYTCTASIDVLNTDAGAGCRTMFRNGDGEESSRFSSAIS